MMSTIKLPTQAPFTRSATGLRRCAVRLAACVAITSLSAFAAAQSSLVPSGVFVQSGAAGSTRAATAGAWWAWDREWAIAGGTL